MADNQNNKDAQGIFPFLHGRMPILTSIERFDPNDEAFIIQEANTALDIHNANMISMEWLYWFRRGMTPVDYKEKLIRPEVNNKITVNYADEICTFKNGYFCTQPIFYTARNDEEETADKVDELNEYLYRSGKQLADNKVVDWFHTVGKADLFVKSNDDKDIPFVAYALDPRCAFVAKSLDPSGRPVYGGYVVKKGDDIELSLWDDTNVYTLGGTKTTKTATPMPEYTYTVTTVIKKEPNPLGKVPIIEYYYNSLMMASFEAAVPLINATSFLQSDRLDAVDQAVQSLLVFYNCELGDDENGDPITPSYVRAAGALFLKSIGESKADLKELVTNLDQSQSQVFIDNLREQILSICAMPFTGANRGYSNAASGTAQFARDGWYQADCAARNTEDLFRESNAYFDEIILHILREKNILDIKATDIYLQFPKNETVNVQSKSQAFQTLLAAGMHPELAAAKSGISNDPVSDIKMSEKYLKMIWGDPDAAEAIDDQVMGDIGETDALEEERLQGNQADKSALDEVLSKGQIAAMQAAQKERPSEGRVRSYIQRRNGRKVIINGYERVKSTTTEKKPE